MLFSVYTNVGRRVLTNPALPTPNKCRPVTSYAPETSHSNLFRRELTRRLSVLNGVCAFSEVHLIRHGAVLSASFTRPRTASGTQPFRAYSRTDSDCRREGQSLASLTARLREFFIFIAFRCGNRTRISPAFTGMFSITPVPYLLPAEVFPLTGMSPPGIEPGLPCRVRYPQALPLSS